MTKFLRIVCVLAILAFITPALFAQDVNMTWGRLNRPEKKGTNYVLLGENSYGLFVMKEDKKKRRYIERYTSDDFKAEYTREIDFKLSKKDNSKKSNLEYENIFIMEDAILLFASSYDKKADLYNLYVRKLKMDGKAEGGWNKLESIVAHKKKNKGDFYLKLTDDKTGFIVTKVLPVKKKEPEKYSFEIYKSDLSKIFSKDVVLRLKKEDSDLQNIRVTQNGKVYFMVHNETNMSLYTFATVEDQAEPTEYKTDFVKKEVIEGFYSFDNEGRVILSGFYSDKSTKNTGISGVFYQKLDPNSLEPTLTSFSAFDKEFLENFLSSRKIRKGKGISTSYDMKHFVIKEDGGVYIVAEETYVVKHCSQSSPIAGAGAITISYQTCTYTYHFNGLIVLNVNPDGKINHSHFIKKAGAASTAYDASVSYSVLYANSKLYLFYNDHYKNYRPGATKVRAMPKYKKRVLAMVTISEDGDVKKEALVRHKDIKLQVLPRKTVRMKGGNGLIMVGFYKKAMKMGRFEIKG